MIRDRNTSGDHCSYTNYNNHKALMSMLCSTAVYGSNEARGDTCDLFPTKCIVIHSGRSEKAIGVHDK